MSTNTFPLPRLENEGPWPSDTFFLHGLNTMQLSGVISGIELGVDFPIILQW